MKKSLTVSANKPPRRAIKPKLDYPLQGTSFDVPLREVMALSKSKRLAYIKAIIAAFKKEVKKDTMALKLRTPFAAEMRDLRKVYYTAPDQYLFTEDGKSRRWVLGKGSPGATHVYWSRNNIWKMKTKGGSLFDQITTSSQTLIKNIDRLLDPEITSKAPFRRYDQSAVRNIIAYLQFDKSSGCAFPPFHAKFIADKFLPKDKDCIVVDPCAGWGGRLIGTLLVHREKNVHYVATDPEIRNKEAYEGLTRRATVWLKNEIIGTRESSIFYEPFEDWVAGSKAKKFIGKTDLVFTSPPYFGAELYNTDNPNQSASRYSEYKIWREGFYRKLIRGAYKLLHPGGYFVLNVADVAEAPRLERDAKDLSIEEGFVWAGFYKLAMSITPAARKAGNARHVLSVKGKDFKYEPVFVFKKPLPREKKS